MSNKSRVTPTVKLLMENGLLETEAVIAALVLPISFIRDIVESNSTIGLTPFSPNTISPYLLKLVYIDRYKPVVEAFVRGMNYLSGRNKYRDEQYEACMSFNIQAYPELLQELELKEVQHQFES